MLLIAGFSINLARADRAVAHVTRPAAVFNERIISHNGKNVPEWDVALSKDARRFFYVASQSPCVWLGSGSRSVVFSFGNDHYVLKCLKAPQYGSWFLQWFFSWRETKPSRRLRAAICSAKLCAEELPEESGVVYAHLNLSRSGMPGFMCKDRYGSEFRLYGNSLRFVVQKKAIPCMQAIIGAMKEDNVVQAKKNLEQIVDLHVNLAKKGYFHKKIFAVGIAEGKAICMDVWRIHKLHPCSPYRRFGFHMRSTFKPLASWLEMTYPELGKYFQVLCEEKLFALKGYQAIE